ncbi:MAG: lipid II flippase MurJ [Methylobacter sp.]|jgi:murein biosynthesis integral membrane protein MurJ
MKSKLTENQFFKGKYLNPQKHFAFILWAVFFCYAICAALIFQKVLLPLLPSMQTGSGLISNDAVFFDSVASSLADKVRENGWSSWRLYPAAGAPGNVAILGALYVLFGHDPSLAIPINAVLHALGGLLIFLLARELANKQSVGTYAGVIAGSLFVIFPSALTWYGQNHKDSYAIAGMLLVLFVWVKAIKNPENNRTWYWLVLGNLVAMILVGIVRPFGLKLLLIATLGVLLVAVVSAILRRKVSAEKKMLVFFLIAVVMLAGAIKTTLVLGGHQSDAVYANWKSETQTQTHSQWQWVNSAWLPDSIENYIETAAKTRAGLIDYGVKINAKSMIDENIAPQSIGGMAAYLPRALQVALFAPFPSSWLTNISMFRLVAVAETFIYYLCVPGIFMLLMYNRKPAVLMAIYFACFFLLVYGVTQANLGTLYRYRYGYLFIMLMLGLVGWFTWLDKTDRLKRLLHLLQPPVSLPAPTGKAAEAGQQPARKEAVGAGILVMGLTFLCFVGFFLRDIMMAHTFGLGASLDNFFIALLIPMFIVTVLCMPLGTALIPVYLDLKERLSLRTANMLVPSVSFWTTISLLVICLILYLIGPYLLPLLYGKEPSPDLGLLTELLDLALPILLFSGVVILGNSVLNAHGNAVVTNTAQLVVPIVAILALLLFGSSYGVKAVMFGMVIGQFMNLLIVQFYLKRHHASLLSPLNLRNQTGLSPLMIQYVPLVISAFFFSVAAPVATLLAMSLPEGSVSAFNLGNKVVLFVTGLVGAAVSTVMLPYFSSLAAKNHLVSARRELSFFLLISTFFSVPISAALYVWSEEIISLIFASGSVDVAATGLVSRVMEYAVVQLPFFVCNALLLKFATATKHVVTISVVAIVGLLVNIGGSILLMQHMGVAGIALGGSVSMLVSTVLLVLVLVRYWHITWFDAVIMLLNWLFFVTLLVCVHFKSVPSIYVIISAYAVLLLGYFNSLKYDGALKVRLSN